MVIFQNKFFMDSTHVVLYILCFYRHLLNNLFVLNSIAVGLSSMSGNNFSAIGMVVGSPDIKEHHSDLFNVIEKLSTCKPGPSLPARAKSSVVFPELGGPNNNVSLQE